MSSDATFQFTQGFSNIYECKWGNIKVSSSDPYILIAFLSLYLQQHFKKHIIIRTMNHEFISSASPCFELGKLYLAWHIDLLLPCLCSYPCSIRAHTHTKKVKSFEIKWQHHLLPQKCWNCEWSWALSFVSPLSLMQAGEAESLALKDTHLAAIGRGRDTDQRYIKSSILFLLNIMIYHWKELE